jgi:aldehyde:ferredoxin oxidoreductase
VTAITNAFMGTMLWVDLTSGSIETTPLEEEEILFWGGPAGLNAKLAHELIPAGCDPLSAENALIIGNGPFVGTTVPAASRPVISAKSPQTGQYATSSPGHFSVMMKLAGYDYLIVTGRSESPVYLTMFDDDVRLVDASDLWGRDIYDTTDTLWERHPESWVGCIGPAAENLTVYGSIVFNKYSLAASTGIGTVMGSKNLKALVAQGTKAFRVADPERFMRLAHEVHVDVMSGPHVTDWRELGTLLQFKSSSAGAKEEMDRLEFDMDAWIRLYKDELHKGPLASPQCPVGCKAMLQLNGEQFPITCPAGTMTMPFALYRKTDPERYVEIAECAQLCNTLGLSTMVITQLVQLAIELWEKGQLGLEMTGGLELRRGDPAVIKQLIIDTAYRRTPLGDAMASPLDVCTRILGEEAERYPKHKGTLASIDQRVSRSDAQPWDAHTFSMIVDPRGPVAENAYISLAWMPGRTEDQIRRYLGKIGVAQEDIDEVATGGTDGWNLAKLTRWVEYYNLVLYDVGSCQRSFISKALPLAKITELYRAGTGLDVDSDHLLLAAERALVMQRLFNVREGLTREMEFGDQSHMKPEHQERLHGLLDEYYGYHGWTLDGVPTMETLERLGLEEYASERIPVGA